MLALPQHLTLSQAPEVLKGLQAAMATQSQAPVVIDAAPLQQIDSAALAVLLACRRSANANKQGFEVLNPPARLVDLATLYGVQDLLGFKALAAT